VSYEQVERWLADPVHIATPAIAGRNIHVYLAINALPLLQNELPARFPDGGTARPCQRLEDAAPAGQERFHEKMDRTVVRFGVYEETA
jgi:hypothetical protein